MLWVAPFIAFFAGPRAILSVFYDVSMRVSIKGAALKEKRL